LALAHMCMFGCVKKDSMFIEGAVELFQMAFFIFMDFLRN